MDIINFQEPGLKRRQSDNVLPEPVQRRLSIISSKIDFLKVNNPTQVLYSCRELCLMGYSTRLSQMFKSSLYYNLQNYLQFCQGKANILSLLGDLWEMVQKSKLLQQSLSPCAIANKDMRDFPKMSISMIKSLIVNRPALIKAISQQLKALMREIRLGERRVVELQKFMGLCCKLSLFESHLQDSFYQQLSQFYEMKTEEIKEKPLNLIIEQTTRLMAIEENIMRLLQESFRLNTYSQLIVDKLLRPITFFSLDLLHQIVGFQTAHSLKTLLRWCQQSSLTYQFQRSLKTILHQRGKLLVEKNGLIQGLKLLELGQQIIEKQCNQSCQLKLCYQMVVETILDQHGLSACSVLADQYFQQEVDKQFLSRLISRLSVKQLFFQTLRLRVCWSFYTGQIIDPIKNLPIKFFAQQFGETSVSMIKSVIDDSTSYSQTFSLKSNECQVKIRYYDGQIWPVIGQGLTLPKKLLVYKKAILKQIQHLRNQNSFNLLQEFTSLKVVCRSGKKFREGWLTLQSCVVLFLMLQGVSQNSQLEKKSNLDKKRFKACVEQLVTAGLISVSKNQLQFSIPNKNWEIESKKKWRHPYQIKRVEFQRASQLDAAIVRSLKGKKGLTRSQIQTSIEANSRLWKIDLKQIEKSLERLVKKEMVLKQGLLYLYST